MREQDRRTFAGLSLDELADRMAGPDPGSPAAHVALCEFTRRQTLEQQRAADAQERAAEAQVQAAAAAASTAEHTKKSARYLLWTVIALVVIAAVNLIVQVAVAP